MRRSNLIAGVVLSAMGIAGSTVMAQAPQETHVNADFAIQSGNPPVSILRNTKQTSGYTQPSSGAYAIQQTQPDGSLATPFVLWWNNTDKILEWAINYAGSCCAFRIRDASNRSLFVLGPNGEGYFQGKVYSNGVALGAGTPGPQGATGPAGPAGPAGPRVGCQCSGQVCKRDFSTGQCVFNNTVVNLNGWATDGISGCAQAATTVANSIGGGMIVSLGCK